ncbi:hypothetical protein FKM82_021680 [Ascaphus truei]
MLYVLFSACLYVCLTFPFICAVESRHLGSIRGNLLFFGVCLDCPQRVAFGVCETLSLSWVFPLYSPGAGSDRSGFICCTALKCSSRPQSCARRQLSCRPLR